MIMNKKGPQVRMDRVFAAWGLSLVAIAGLSCGITSWLSPAATVTTDPILTAKLEALTQEIEDMRVFVDLGQAELDGQSEEIQRLRQALYRARAEAALSRKNAEDERAAKEALALRLARAIEAVRAKPGLKGPDTKKTVETPVTETPAATAPNARALTASILEHMTIRPSKKQLAEHLSWTVRKRALLAQARAVIAARAGGPTQLDRAVELLETQPEPSWTEIYTRWLTKKLALEEALRRC